MVEQKPFNGKPNKLEDFIAECELTLHIFNVKPDIYQQDNQKIVYVLQLMTQGIAGPWKSTYILQEHAETDMLKIVYVKLFKMWAELMMLSSG